MSLIEANFDKEITLERYKGEGGTGPQYKDPEKVEGMVEQSRSWTRNAEGDVVVSDSTLYLPDDIIPPPAQSRVIFDDKEHFILTVRKPRDRLLNETHHIECDLV